MKKSCQAEKQQNAEKRTRGQCVIDITKLILCKYPARWTANEISTALSANVRTVTRVVRDMTESGLLDRKYNSYSISPTIVHQFYKAKWAVDNEVEKIVMVESKKSKKRGSDE